MAIPLEWIVGPLGGFAILLVIARELWKAHTASDADVKAQRDAAIDRLERVIGLAEKADKP